MEITKITLVLMMILSAGCKSQHRELSIKEQEAFLVGMFNYQSGNVWIKEHPKLKNRVTFLFSGKEQLISIFKDTLRLYEKKTKTDFTITKDGFVEVFVADGVENPFLRFFKLEAIENNSYYDDDLDRDFEVVRLSLKKEAFQTQNEKLYFLLGAFINCGKKGNNQFSYTYPDAHYIAVISDLLEETGSTIVAREKEREAMPGYDKIIFVPSPKLQALLNTFKI
jgi:hypothetical protein